MWAWPIGMFFFSLRRPLRGRFGAGIQSLLLGGLLLARDLHALGSLARASVVLGVLSVNGQAATMPQPAIAADLLEEAIRGRAADAVDVGHADLDALVERDVDPSDSCHLSRYP